VHDFFDGFAAGARANVHAKVLYGRSSHHHVEAVFKAFARALRFACARDARLKKMLPSTKGLL
jgi:imidazoleglycerol-phosphate dehydratase